MWNNSAQRLTRSNSRLGEARSFEKSSERFR
jgi:hypothetical protein